MYKEESEIYWAIEDHVADNHEFCTIKEIANETGFSRRKCEKIVQELINKDQIDLAYKSRGRGSANIYIPKYMMTELLRTQRKPRWLNSYVSEEKRTYLGLVKQLCL